MGRTRTGRTPIGIEVGTQHLSAVQLARAGRGLRIEAAVSLPRRDGAAVPGPAETAQFADVLDRQGFRGRRVVLGVPQECLLSDVFAIKTAGEGGAAELVRERLAKAHGHAQDSFEFAWWELPAQRRTSEGAPVMAVACPHADAEALLDAFEEAGLLVEALDVPALALARACRPLLAGAQGPAAILSAGWRSAGLIVVQEGVVIYSRQLTDSGVEQLERALREKLALEPDVALYLIREMGAPQEEGPDGGAALDMPEEVTVEIGVYMDKLVGDLRPSLAYVSREFGAERVDRLIVVGEGAAVPGLVEHLTAALGLSVRPARVRDLAECAPSAAAAGPLSDLGVALGLAQRGSVS